jgi:uncharacterized membrane protein
VTVLYPVLPWLGFMSLGYVLGTRLATGELSTARPWATLAIASAIAFSVVRGLDQYGNFELLRGGDAVIDWLRTSRYPPSISYAASELAIVFVLLAIWTKWPAPSWLLVLGRTALFFYVLHIHLLKGVAFALGVHRSCGLVVTYVAWLASLAVLYPACVAFDRWKQRYPRSPLRFL